MSLQSDLMAALTGVVSGRVYAQMAPEDAPMPFVVYRTLEKDPLMNLAGVILSTRYTVVFDCWGASYLDALNTANSIRSAIDANSTLNSFHVPASGEDYEPAIDAFIEPVHYGFWVNNS